MRYVTLTNPDTITTQDVPFGKPNPRVVESPGRDILNYPIEEPDLTPEGELREKAKPPFYETTGRSLEWSIKRGETLEIPEYVAKVLKNRYDFLEISEITNPEKKVETTMSDPHMARPKEGEVQCKHCGQVFKRMRGLALHISHKHPEKII